MAGMVESKVTGELGILILNNPPFNSLKFGVFQELAKNLEELLKNDQVKAIIFTALGNTIFSAGADVKEICDLGRSGDRKKGEEAVRNLHKFLFSVENSSKPTIAAINGICLGGGLELALACQYRVASQETKFGLPEINLGLIPGLGGTQRLPRLIGVKNAMKVLLGGKEKLTDLKTAKSIGLVDEAAEKELIPAVKQFIRELAASPISRSLPADQELDPKDFQDGELYDLAKGKSVFASNALVDVVRQGMNKPIAKAVEIETQGFLDCLFNGDGLEGLSAFLEKRKPVFKELVGIEKKPESKQENQPASQPDAKEEDYKSLRSLVREFANEQIRPKIEVMEKEERVDGGLMKAMADLGFFGILFPEEYGGLNLGKTGYCILMEELGRVHGSTATQVGAHMGLACAIVNSYGSPEQKNKYLRSGIKGELTGAFALTENEAGSDVAGMATKAEKKGEKWLINGTKQFITNGDIADFVIVFAQTNPELKQKGITAFIVDSKSPGFQVGKIEEKMGNRSSRTAALIFDNVEVSAESLIGEVGEGFKIAMTTLNGGRLSLAAGCLGAAKEAFSLAYNYAGQRRVFDKLLLEIETLQNYFSEMARKILMMQCAVYKVAAMADQGRDIRFEAAVLKKECSEASEMIVDMALQIFGGYGYIKEYSIERMYRDSRINRIWEGTNEIQDRLIFKEIFTRGGDLF